MKAKDFVSVFANDIKRELLRKNSTIESATDNWGIVTTNIVSQYVVEDITTDITIDVSQYGFSNIDDFDIIATVTGVASERGTWGIQNKTTSTVTIGLFCALSTTLYFHYTIIAKGFGGGSGSPSGNRGINFEVGAERWYGTYTENGVTYQVYSKIVYIPALPAEAGITNVPHGVTGIKQILAVQGFCSNSMIMNAPRQNLQDNISIYQVQKSGNIAIEVGKDRSSVSAYVTLIYAKNN